MNMLYIALQVAFPALEYLLIYDVPNITEIWDKKSLPESEKETQSFWRLGDIDIHKCNQLVYVLPCYMLPQLQINLQRLSIWDCKEVEVIVSKELKENEIIVFHQLKHVHFWRLPKLKSFYTGTELLFSDKVAFPSLEWFSIMGLPMIKEIWPYKQPLPEPGKEAESFCKLSKIRVEDCDQLVYVFPFYILRQLQHLEMLKIEYCKNVEVIVSAELKEEEVIHNDIVFPQLKTVRLWGLPNLKRICSETQLFFSDKHAFPALEGIGLYDKDLEFLLDGTSTKEVLFPIIASPLEDAAVALAELMIKFVYLFKYLAVNFPSSSNCLAVGRCSNALSSFLFVINGHITCGNLGQ
ncbi:hypothetical protein Vadar_026098 [Vaccinium darrowii]|uniref:Uncharacterized protein n=1 Tax=Vaccinium darrowii TaxID=229202 RepID=A0ACB7YQ80_9ERIC|nr:hypothetical protein Vadar_026098 [Vaccinium darrowii]